MAQNAKLFGYSTFEGDHSDDALANAEQQTLVLYLALTGSHEIFQGFVNTVFTVVANKGPARLDLVALYVAVLKLLNQCSIGMVPWGERRLTLGAR